MINLKKYSRKREAILNKINSTTSHPTAEWIYASLKSEFPDLSLGTVYRNLAEFLKDGIIKSVGVINGQEHFDGNTAPHTHLICQNCGRIIDVDYPFDVDKNCFNNIMVNDFELTLYGLCDMCM